jgi:hypothetical protein
MPHLALEEGIAVAGDDWLRHEVLQQIAVGVFADGESLGSFHGLMIGNFASGGATPSRNQPERRSVAPMVKMARMMSRSCFGLRLATLRPEVLVARHQHSGWHGGKDARLCGGRGFIGGDCPCLEIRRALRAHRKIHDLAHDDHAQSRL